MGQCCPTVVPEASIPALKHGVLAFESPTFGPSAIALHSEYEPFPMTRGGSNSLCQYIPSEVMRIGRGSLNALRIETLRKRSAQALLEAYVGSRRSSRS